MISKNQLKLITSLSQKKYRTKHQLFVVEGIKMVHELLNSTFLLKHLFYTEDFEATTIKNKTLISHNELKKISNLKTPNKVLALFEIPSQKTIQKEEFILALDGINDPGNLGTIIRLCDWFGVKQIVCSTNTVDLYNQKVAQATMGSLTRVQVNYTHLHSFLSDSNLPIYIADMNGENLYKSTLPKNGILVMGNEANGISKEIKLLDKVNITIPRFEATQQTESLNVATATAIILSEFRRNFTH